MGIERFVKGAVAITTAVAFTMPFIADYSLFKVPKADAAQNGESRKSPYGPPVIFKLDPKRTGTEKSPKDYIDSMNSWQRLSATLIDRGRTIQYIVLGDVDCDGKMDLLVWGDRMKPVAPEVDIQKLVQERHVDFFYRDKTGKLYLAKQPTNDRWQEIPKEWAYSNIYGPLTSFGERDLFGDFEKHILFGDPKKYFDRFKNTLPSEPITKKRGKCVGFN